MRSNSETFCLENFEQSHNDFLNIKKSEVKELHFMRKNEHWPGLEQNITLDFSESCSAT